MEERIWHKAYDPQVPPSIDYEKITLPQGLERSARDYPGQSALVLMGRKISYPELNGLVNRFAAALQGLGVRKGDKVALLLPNIPQGIIAVYGAFKLGAVVVMNNPLYTETELEYQLKDSEATVAVTLDLLIPRLLKIKDKTDLRTIISCHIRTYLPFPARQLFPFVKKELHRKPVPGEGV
jgi:long-chain acyl-CoA synthetase